MAMKILFQIRGIYGCRLQAYLMTEMRKLFSIMSQCCIHQTKIAEAFSVNLVK